MSTIGYNDMKDTLFEVASQNGLGFRITELWKC